MFCFQQIYHFVVKMWWKCDFVKSPYKWHHRWISSAACRLDEAFRFDAASVTSLAENPRPRQGTTTGLEYPFLNVKILRGQ